jgi:HPt (histidine-containing phosphotransfer) domain-containing protein
MSDFQGMEDLLQDFLVEATDLLSGVDNKLVDLEKTPNDRGLLNEIFRGFHTIKGGAGFLNAAELVSLCHLTENLFDKLRNGEMAIYADSDGRHPRCDGHRARHVRRARTRHAARGGRTPCHDATACCAGR